MLLPALLAPAAAKPYDPYREGRRIYDRGDWHALAEFTQAALSRLPDDSSDVALKLRILRAAAYYQTNQKLAAEVLPAELPPRLSQSEAAVIRLRVLAALAHFNNDDVAAARYVESAERLARRKYPRLLSEVVVSRSYLSQYGLKEREAYARTALRLARRYPDARSELVARATLSRNLGLQERYDEAVTIAEGALKVAAANHFDSLFAQTEGNLGWLYVDLGDPDLAEQYLRDALAKSTRLGLKRDFLPWHLQFGNIAVKRGDLATAATEYGIALDLATQQKKGRGPVLANLASVALEAHHYDEARRYNEQAIEAKQAEKDATGVLRSQILNARIDRETNRLEEAQRTLEDVVTHSDSRFIRFEGETELARVAVERKAADDAGRHFHAALSTIDDARADIKSDDLKLPFANLSASLYRDYVDFLAAAGRSRDALRVAELSRARTLAEGLGVERDRTGEFDPESIARKAGVTVLSYWLAPRHSLLFVITAEGVQHFVLPSADTINDKIDAYQKDLDNVARGAELYSLLVAPAASAIRGTRLAVIPDGHLAAFNFETLRTPRGRYWIEDVTLESANALQFVDATKRPERGKLLLIGNAVKADPQFPSLPHAGEEIAGIEKYFDRRTTLAGVAATPGAYLKSNPESYAYVHFVAHAAATRQRPLDSAVILGPDANGYKLYARDVVAHPLKARLVTISSCHSAGKRAFAGEGLVGLAWAFLRAGAHEVVAAFGEGHDASTVGLMEVAFDFE